MSARTIGWWALAVALVASEVGAGEARVAVVVHAERRVGLTVEELAHIFLKQRLFWSDGARILPVNRDAPSDVRRAFTRWVFGDRAGDLGAYWNRQYFQGVLPPATLASDEAVKRYVASEPGAIGYVSERSLDETVRLVRYLP